MRSKVRLLRTIMVLLTATVLWADIPEGYYDRAAVLTGEQLKAALHKIIRDHKEYPYGAVWNILKYTDQDPDNPDNVIFFYTGWSKSRNHHGGGQSQWNREHVWAKSHGEFGTRKGAGTDVHHLRPTDTSVNSRRSNLDFDVGGNLYIDPDGATQCRYDSDSFEPRDAVKGDVARMIFYMAVRYEGGEGEPDLELNDRVNNGRSPRLGKLSVLLKWHKNDPPDDFERRRNDRIYEKQLNRNPFIDHPEYASIIWGGADPGPGPGPVDDDTTAPMITRVNVSTAFDSAVISWITDEPASSIVYYGKSCSSLIHTASDGTLTERHMLTLKNLEPGATYYFSVSATDARCNGPACSPVQSFTVAEEEGGPGSKGIVITEIAANPSGSYKNEYVELYNASDREIDVNGWLLVIHRKGAGDVVVEIGVTGNHEGSTAIAPGEFYLVTRGNVDYANKTRFPSFYLNKTFYVELKKDGEVVDKAGNSSKGFAKSSNYELKDKLQDNEPTSAWEDKGKNYNGSAGRVQ